GRKRRIDVAPSDAPCRSDELLAPLRFVDGEDRIELLDVDLDGSLRPGNGLARLGGDDDDRLPDEGDFVLGQQNLVLDDRAEQVVFEIVERVEADDARDVARGGGVEGTDTSVRDGRPEEIDDQLVARGRRVID